MPLIGNIIKGALSITSEVDLSFRDDLEKQAAQLRTLLEKSQDTAFGKYYNFNKILDSRDVQRAFGEAVPIFQYDEMYQRWWSQQLKNPDITWPGQPDFYARSSGTTGKESKRIPVTDEFIASMRSVSFDLLKTIPSYDLADEVFESEVLVISSSASLTSNDNGYLEGEISGINVYNLPDWYNTFYRPGKEIAQIPNWHDRLERIVDEAPGWNVGAIAGIPSWVLQILRAIVRRYDVPSIKAIWPNLSIYMSGGVAFNTYRESFRNICGDDIHVIDTYLASEGFFAYSDVPSKMDMKLALDHGYYYEFIPFDGSGFDEQGNVLEDPKVIGLGEVEEGQEYALVVSTCAGAWRYMIGDTIKFTSSNPYRITLTGRTKFFLNVTGSQLSEEKLDDAVTELSRVAGGEINEYSVGALEDENGEYYHQWVLVSDADIKPETAGAILDRRLRELNHNYDVARGKALKDVKVRIISRSKYLSWLESGKQLGGQVKVPKVMSSKRMKNYLKALDNSRDKET